MELFLKNGAVIILLLYPKKTDLPERNLGRSGDWFNWHVSNERITTDNNNLFFYAYKLIQSVWECGGYQENTK